MNTLPEKFHTLFLPELSEGPLVRNTRWMIGGHNVLESVSSRHREMIGSVSNGQDNGQAQDFQGS